MILSGCERIKDRPTLRALFEARQSRAAALSTGATRVRLT
ncbi:hypothetical protein BN2497_7685 [Janthinobacterium sp. CG23_2]|nr:hypothetical protein BN2497_7685 [Janthinobacterium sp. CG23_2]CUU30240.1 hypothetical protein BN3177_7685 [Janthinobacterium sp. CG23_2]